MDGSEPVVEPNGLASGDLADEPGADIVEQLRQDYRRFPQGQSYDLYAEDVYFKDPLSEFRGLGRYRRMIGWIERWFRQPELTLHHISRSHQTITTRWTLAFTAPLPWQPRIVIPGWSELTVNDQEKITTHIDHWDCPRGQVLLQALGLA